MELPGSFSGKLSSPRPHLGPEPRNLKSLAILKTLTAAVFMLPENSTIGSSAARASNLLFAVLKGRFAILDISLATSLSKPTFVFKPVPTAVPPCAR